jgi:hypothetical protein
VRKYRQGEDIVMALCFFEEVTTEIVGGDVGICAISYCSVCWPYEPFLVAIAAPNRLTFYTAAPPHKALTLDATQMHRNIIKTSLRLDDELEESL